MENLADKIINVDYDELENKLPEITLDEQIGLVVIFKGIEYEFLIHIKSTSEDLLCLGYSNLFNKELLSKFKDKHHFSRGGWDFNESTIFYNDNAHYAGDGAIGTSWCIGLPEDYFLENIKNIILKITRFFNIKNENILFFGSSMGGFISIQLATMIKSSHAIAENPQIDAAMWMKKINEKNNFCSELYDETTKKMESYRYNVLDMIKKENYVPNLTIVICISEENLNNQLKPFIKELSSFPFDPFDFHKIKIIIEPTIEQIPISNKYLQELLDFVNFNRGSLGKIYYNDIDAAIPVINEMGLFDEEYYKLNYNINILDPLTHYLLIGWKEGLNPSEQFDNKYYLDKYDDVKNINMNPLVHYVLYGMNENRLINKKQELNKKQSFIKIIKNKIFK